MGPGVPGGPPGQPGPPPGAGPGGTGPPGPPGMASGQMYGNNMMPDVRMRAAAQSRYRLGNPSASSMRQPMQPGQGPGGPGPGGPGPGGPGPGPGPPGGMTVPTGQQSPMGGPGNIPNMPNPGMRPQVCAKIKIGEFFLKKLSNYCW